jgi:hypothetical protein
MPRSSKRNQAAARRSRGSRSRHGRQLRSSATGPWLPQLTGRVPRFHLIVAETLGFLRAMAPEQLAPVRIFTAPMPADDQHRDGMDRWQVRPPHEVILFRVPLERLAKLSLSDPRDQIRYREYIERAVISAVNELLDGGLTGLVSDDLLEPPQ